MRSIAKILCLAAILSMTLAVTLASGSTVTSHSFLNSFDGSATPAGSFSSPGKMAIDQNTDTLYVLDVGHGVLDKFDLSTNPPTPENFSALGTSAIDGAGLGNCIGTPTDCDQTPQGALGLTTLADVAVDNSGTATEGNIYISSETSHYVSAFDSAGNYLFTLGDAVVGDSCGVAVDSSGAIHVAEANTGISFKFIPSGGTAIHDAAGDFPINEVPCDLAMDSLNNTFTGKYWGGAEEYSSTGTLLKQFEVNSEHSQPNPFNVAVDPSGEDIYIGPSLRITSYNSQGDPIANFGAESTSKYLGLGVDGSNSNVYGSEALSNSIKVFAPIDITAPDVTASSVDVTPFSATLNGMIDPLGGPMTSYHFEYRLPGALSWTALPQHNAGGAEEVSDQVSGLQANTAYEARLVGKNTEKEVFSYSNVLNFTTGSLAPTLLTSPAAAVSDSAATLYGSLVPNSPGTKYHFEYGKTDEYGIVVPLPDGDAGSGNSPVLVSEHISDLTPGTIYHFRLVATNSVGTSFGVDRTLKTSDPSISNNGIPDDRVYEKVSPSEKEGSPILRYSYSPATQFGSYLQVSTNGDAVTYSTTSVFEGESGIVFGQYLSRRGPSGWSTIGLAPPGVRAGAAPASRYRWFSPDLHFGSVGVNGSIHTGDPESGPVPGTGYIFPYLRDTTIPNDAESSAYKLLTVPSLPLPPTNPHEIANHQPSFAIGSSLDGSHVAVDSPLQLTPDAPNGGAYEWIDGTLHYLGEGHIGSSKLQFASESGGAENYPGDNPISEDGSRIFFSEGGLSVSENGVTRHIAGGDFQAAKPSDGSVAFFLSSDQLTDDATAQPGHPDLYRWDAKAPLGEQITDLTTADPAGGGVGAINVHGSGGDGYAVGGVLGISRDATTAYFVATGVLARGAREGVPNLYVWKQGEGVRLVVTLSDKIDPDLADVFLDRRAWARNFRIWGEGRGGYSVSSDGSAVLFESYAQLTPFDTNGFKQVYLYDLPTEEITCVSCSRAAPSSRGDVYLDIATGTKRYIRGYSTFAIPHNVSSDGDRAFFDTTEALLPRDTNGKVDLYEWENGMLHLISPGSGTTDSNWIGASLSGDDVFFVTADPLVRSDEDQLADLYDARVKGTPEPATRAPCVGDECQGTPAPPPLFNDLGSSRYDGPGNANRELRKKKHKKKQHRKHHRHSAKKQATSRHG